MTMSVHDVSFTAAGFERAARRRSHADWLAEQWASDSASYMRVRSGRVAVTGDPGDPKVDWRPASTIGRIPDTDWALLAERSDGSAVFAVSETGGSGSGSGGDNSESGGHGSESGGHGSESGSDGSGSHDHASDMGLRELLMRLGDPADTVLTGALRAVGVLNWHETHHWCPRCGAPTRIAEAGWMRVCEREGTRHFPKVEPAVIVLVSDPEGRGLLGRQSGWPAGRFSTLAGFVEPGESFEEAVAREVYEEVGVAVAEVEYFGSQPWPFPASVMVGFLARTAAVQPVRPDGVEIAEAEWFSRGQLLAACTSGDVSLPPVTSISRKLINEWHGGDLPGNWSGV